MGLRPHQPRASPIEVWVLEDNDLLRTELSQLIDSAEGMHCDLAADRCETALAALGEGRIPDIVLMDIGLAGIDGIEGTRRLRAASPSSRVAMLTIHEEDEKVFNAVCAGASGYLLKPSEPEHIIAAIRDLNDGSAPINGFIASRMLEMFSDLGSRFSLPAEDYGLTQREREILKLLVDGMSTDQIAVQLSRSYHTVDSHIRNIYDKLHVHSRSLVIAKAVRERLY